MQDFHSIFFWRKHFSGFPSNDWRVEHASRPFHFSGKNIRDRTFMTTVKYKLDKFHLKIMFLKFNLKL